METGNGAVGFSIGEVSQAIGLAPQTLRLWERERLVRPRRTGRGYRVYTEPDVARLRKKKRLRKVEGLNFAAIRKQLGTLEEAPEDSAADAGSGGTLAARAWMSGRHCARLTARAAIRYANPIVVMPNAHAASCSSPTCPDRWSPMRASTSISCAEP